MDSGEGPRARALLLEGVAGAGGALGAGEDAARGQEDDVAVRELLLELAGQAAEEDSLSAGGSSNEYGRGEESSLYTYRCWTRWKP